MTKTDASSFVGYCGLYCNACGIRQEKIKNAVNNLRGIIAHYGFDKMMPELAKWEPSLQTLWRIQQSYGRSSQNVW